MTDAPATSAAPSLQLGTTLVIANPVAQSGKGAVGARLAEEHLHERLAAGANGELELRLTQHPLHAVEIAAEAGAYDTVIALGGDGIIHEVVNGLMQVDEARRPRLGVIPLGSGNDYARTLGMARNRPVAAANQILAGTTRRIDLGWVNGTYFDNTLSFGLDAAIAIDTMERRKKNGAHGTLLFAASGIDVFMNRMKAYRYTAQVISTGPDGQEQTRELAGEELVFAVQVGPTYGGGFLISPQANAFDGLLDLCYSVRTPSKTYTLGLFLSAKFGLHVHSNAIRSCQAGRLVIEFPDEEPPSQVDGEAFCGQRFEVRAMPAALEVIVP